jgi:hypothetical protein
MEKKTAENKWFKEKFFYKTKQELTIFVALLCRIKSLES